MPILSYLLCGSDCFSRAYWELFQFGSQVPFFDKLFYLFEYFLTFCYYKMLPTHLIFFPGISQISEENGIRKQELGSPCVVALGVSVHLGLLRQQSYKYMHGYYPVHAIRSIIVSVSFCVHRRSYSCL